MVCEGGGWIEDTKNRADYDRSVFLVLKMVNFIERNCLVVDR